MGEYARCLALANAVQVGWPQVEIRFLLSRHAPYAATTPFPVDLLPASVTLASREALAALEAFQPDAIVFDNAGRSRQLAAARRLGARIIYISSRARQRRKGFRLGWMRAIDEHWIAYPPALVGGLGPVERIKRALLGRPTIRFLDMLLPPADDAAALPHLNGPTWPRIVVVPGGGSAHPGALDAPARFAAAATQLAASGIDTAFVAGPAFSASLAAHPQLCVVRQADGGALRSLLEHAEVVLANGGDTLIQALVLRRACVAVPIAADQRERITRCAALGIVVAPDIEGAAQACVALLSDAASRARLQQRIDSLGWCDGMPEALAALGRAIRG